LINRTFWSAGAFTSPDIFPLIRRPAEKENFTAAMSLLDQPPPEDSYRHADVTMT
jgi:hypothetical protein